MFVSGNIKPLKLHEVTFDDGYTSGFYTIQKGAAPEINTLLFFVGGSGNVSHNYYLQKYFEEMHGHISIYALQKRYVGQREIGLFGASGSFYKYNHYAQLVQDQKEFIQYILANSDHVGKKIIIFGVSEGGNIAAQLASEIAEITHLMILGSGGMIGIDEFKLWGDKHGIDFEKINKEVERFPDSVEKKVLGQTYKYWASILPVDPMASLKKLEIPIFAAFGESDEMVPVESVHFLRDEFKRQGKENLTVKIFPDCNHVLDDSAGKNHRGELFRLAARWWKEE
jgi:pimeloyl-ACP methyl ester carboxylesterase